MGYMKHHAIVVTGELDEEVEKAHSKAKEIFGIAFKSGPHEKPYASRLVSEIILGLANSQSSFFIAPDGSKEGWETSDRADGARSEFLNWLQGADTHCDYVELYFGGDDETEDISRSNYTIEF